LNELNDNNYDIAVNDYDKIPFPTDLPKEIEKEHMNGFETKKKSIESISGI